MSVNLLECSEKKGKIDYAIQQEIALPCEWNLTVDIWIARGDIYLYKALQTKHKTQDK